MDPTNPSGTTTEPQQITVEQLAAQLSKRASPATGATGKPNAAVAALNEPPAGEAPAGQPAGTETDLFDTSLAGGDAGNPADTDGEGQSAGAAAAEDEEGGEQDSSVPEWYQKRAAKFRAKRQALEERLVAAEKRLQETEAKLNQAQQQTAPKTKAWNSQEQQLNEQLAGKRALLRWAEENADGATVTDTNGGEVNYTPDQIRAVKLSALEDIGDLRGRLREAEAETQRARQTWDAEALKAYPQLKDPNNPMTRNIDLMIERVPWLRELPDARLSLADMMAGRAARLRKPAGAASSSGGSGGAPARVVTGGAAAAPARTAGAGPSEAEKKANEDFQQSGRVEDLSRRFALSRKV
jgi:hypothetical protein